MVVLVVGLNLFMLATLILKNGAKLVKEYPHIPGIDFSGKVIESDNKEFKFGDEVVLTGCRVGEIYPGGYSQITKVKSELLVKKPQPISNRAQRPGRPGDSRYSP